MKVIACIVWFCLLIHSARGQDYVQDFEKIRQGFYQKDKMVSFAISYRYFDGPASKLCTDSLKGNYLMYGDSYRYELSGITMVRGEKYYVVVNDHLKTITIEKTSAAPSQFSFAFVDSIAKQKGITVKNLKSADNKTKGYHITGFKGDITELEIWFDPLSYRVQKMVLQYDRQYIDTELKEPRVIVDYKNYRTGPVTDVFTEKGILYRAGIEWKAVDKYKNYRLIDHSMTLN